MSSLCQFHGNLDKADGEQWLMCDKCLLKSYREGCVITPNRNDCLHIGFVVVQKSQNVSGIITIYFRHWHNLTFDTFNSNRAYVEHIIKSHLFQLRGDSLDDPSKLRRYFVAHQLPVLK